MINFTFKKIATGLITLFLIVAVFMFRDKISVLFSFGPDFSPVNPQEISLPFSTSASSPEVLKSKEVKNETPSYAGRDPQEVRPSPEEVKLFSAEQKEKIYGELRMHGSAVKEKPDYFFGWIQVGLLKKVIGDFEGARDAWEYAGVISPKNSVSFANLGELYWRYLPNFPKSEANFKISIKNKPNDSSTYMSLSDLYRYSFVEKKDLADDVLLEGVNANPNSIDLMKQLARLYEFEGKYVLAVTWLQKVLAADSSNAEVATEIEVLKKRISK